MGHSKSTRDIDCLKRSSQGKLNQQFKSVHVVNSRTKVHLWEAVPPQKYSYYTYIYPRTIRSWYSWKHYTHSSKWDGTINAKQMAYDKDKRNPCHKSLLAYGSGLEAELVGKEGLVRQRTEPAICTHSRWIQFLILLLTFKCMQVVLLYTWGNWRIQGYQTLRTN